MSESTHLPAYTQPFIKQKLIESAVSGTIYAFVFPESRKILEEVLDGGDRDRIVEAAVNRAIENFGTAARNDLAAAITHAVQGDLREARSEYLAMYERAWTSRQDAVHENFFAAWKRWSAPIVTLDENITRFAYPTEGASTALREAINACATKARVDGTDPVVHVFEGEYEGFKAFAEAAKLTVKQHPRAAWEIAIPEVGPHDMFFVSQPSAIDGNVWEDFDAFADELGRRQPQAKIMLDLTYVGMVAREFNVQAAHPNVHSVFFSLSKPFGTYYQRIGGMFCREEMPGLLGNKWFKVLQGLQVGTALLERSTPFDLPQKYEATRAQAVSNAGERLGLDLRASDVTLFATAPAEQADDPVKQSLLRGAQGRQQIRVCITPEFARLVPGGVFVDKYGDEVRPPSAARGVSMRDMTI